MHQSRPIPATYIHIRRPKAGKEAQERAAYLGTDSVIGNIPRLSRNEID
jgi:hypothetical protein